VVLVLASTDGLECPNGGHLLHTDEDKEIDVTTLNDIAPLFAIIRGVIAQLPEYFRTLDVTDSAAMLAAEAQFLGDRSRRPITAKWLARSQAELGIELMDDRPHQRGALWCRTAH